MKKSYLIALVTAILALLWILSGALFPSAKQVDKGNGETIKAHEESTAKETIRVKTAIITAETITQEVTVTGRSQASRNVDLSAEISGRIQTLAYEEGDSVDANTLLLTIDKQDKRQRVSEAKELVEQRRIQYDAAKKLQAKGFNSDVRLAEAVAQLESAKASLKQAQVALDNTEIKAPFSGILDSQYVEIGQFVSIGDPLFSLVQLDPIEFTGFVTEKQVLKVQQGASAKIELINGETFNGRISFVASAANPETRTFRIIATVENPDNRIADGLTAKIRVPVDERRGFKIPSSSLTLDSDGIIGVKTVDADNIVRFLPIDIIIDTKDYMWASAKTDQINLITVGQDFVIDGQEVKTDTTKASAPSTQDNTEDRF